MIIDMCCGRSWLNVRATDNENRYVFGWTWLNVRATDNENRYMLLVDLAKCESHRQ